MDVDESVFWNIMTRCENKPQIGAITLPNCQEMPSYIRE